MRRYRVSSNSGRSPLAAVGLGVFLGLAGMAGLAACADGGQDSAVSADSGSTTDGTATPSSGLPIATTPVEDSTGLVRYTDRELDVRGVQAPKTGRDSASIARKIADARRAGPVSITDDASYIDRSAEVGGPMLPIRAGTNSWVCVPDDPITPVDDPVCLNSVAQRWASGAFMGRESFSHRGLGVGYKLRGGVTASSTDPYLIRPLDGESWIIEPPHVILIFQDTTGLGALPDHPGQGGPWVSWRGTPYMHVKVPISP